MSKGKATILRSHVRILGPVRKYRYGMHDAVGVLTSVKLWRDLVTNTRVIIVGGGFSGAFAAKHLRRLAPEGVDIELISDRNYFVFQPLLPEVAAGTINAMDAVTPLRLMLKGVKVRMGNVQNIDFDQKVVELVQGSKRVPIECGYDHLVLALGQETRLDRFPGFAEHSLRLRDLNDAHELRNHIIQCLEHADVTENTSLKRKLLTFVVVGGGFSGVEAVGEAQEMIERALPLYPNVHKEELRILLVQRGDRILPELSPKLGDYAAKKLIKRGVEVMLNTSLSRATASAVFTQDGACIECLTLVTTIGNGPSHLVENLNVPLNRGKIVTDQTLAVVGVTSVWALGDAALIPLENDTFAPPTAQFAVQEAKAVARNIVAHINDKEPDIFRYRPRGSLASIGRYRAVAEIFGVRLSGLFAWLMWRGFYLTMLPKFSTKIRVALNWLFDYFLPRSIVQINTSTGSAARLVHYAKGDVLFEPDQLVDGFYSVVSGCLESRVPSNGQGEDFVRVLGKGEHWGERSLTEGYRTRGQLTAVEDSTVLILNKEDFVKLMSGFPVMENYIKKIPQKIYSPELRDDLS